jgi:cytoskeletal protein CcmA (bactofilin family)
MMGRNNPKSNFDRPTTVIGKDTTIEMGTLVSKSSIQNNGSVSCELNIESSLVVGETGSVTGNIKTAFILIAGEIIGNIDALEQVHLTKTGKVKGDIECTRIVIDEGGIIEGNVKMKVSKDPIPKKNK